MRPCAPESTPEPASKLWITVDLATNLSLRHFDSLDKTCSRIYLKEKTLQNQAITIINISARINGVVTLGSAKGIKIPGFLETFYWSKSKTTTKCLWAIFNFQFISPVMGLKIDYG